MSQTAVLVWLSASSLLPTFRADLDAFAHSRLLRLEAPRENAAPSGVRASAYAPDAVAQIESSLEEARNAGASLEQSRALAALETAERVLREHPELPQSAWLMAEIWQQTAEIENTVTGGAQAATVLQQRAASLEGPRDAAFSDRTPALGNETSSSDTHSLRVEGLEPGDALEWDGRRTPATLLSAAGEHHVRVLRGERLLWAGWTKVAAAEPSVRLPVPETVACSADDIGGGHFAAGRAVAAPHARCDSYVLARAREGGIEAALCEREHCGNVVLWEHPPTSAAPEAASKKTIWPYAIAATAGALVITGIALWRAGVFDNPAPSSHEVWVFSGQKQQMGLRF